LFFLPVRDYAQLFMWAVQMKTIPGFSEILSFRTLSIVQVLKDKTKEEHDVSETGSASVLR
jgi:hypothetical protein